MRRAELQWIVLLLIAAAAGAQTVRSVGKQTYVDPYKAASEFDPVILPEHGKVEYQIDQRRGKPMLVYRFDYDIKISGPGVFNVRWSQAGGEETQVECGPLNDDCYVVLRNNEFRLYNVDRNAPYAFRAQACIKREPARSKCSPWSEPAYYLPYGAATCKIGFVWRAADPNDKVCVIPSSRSRAAADNARGASAACAPGYAWREAFAGDHVCVTLATSDETRIENASNNAHRVIDQSYGPDTCKPGFVWREAGPADHVCVLPETKVFTQADNAQAAQRRVEGGDACKPGWV